MKRILTINPGSTSTKIAVFDDDKMVFKESLTHETERLAKFNDISEQLPYRTSMVIEALNKNNIPLESIDAFSGRGGGLVAVKGGTYEVNDKLLHHAQIGYTMKHASVLGAQIAHNLAKINNKKAYVVNPVTVDEKQEIARITGIKGIYGQTVFHALNQKEVAHKYAKSIGKRYEDLNLIVVHLGGGISVGAHKNGKVIDVNNGLNGEGPFAPTRSGKVLATDLIDMCFSGKYTENEIKELITKKGGLISHLDTSDARDVVKMISEGNKYAKLVYDAMIYQVAKEVGAQSVVLKGEIDAIILTGGIAYEEYFVKELKEYIEFLGKIIIIPGEEEMQALANGVLRVLNGEEEAQEYTGIPVNKNIVEKWKQKTSFVESIDK